MFKFHRVIVRTVALIALPALLVVESACATMAVEPPPTVTVRYDDLNLNSPKGVARLYTRIQNAATEVCKSVEGPQTARRLFWPAWNECFHRGIANAVQDVHNDKLSAYHEERSRGWHYEAASTPTTVAGR
jgi:UrcA family protein